MRFIKIVRSFVSIGVVNVTYVRADSILQLAVGFRILADSVQSIGFHEVNRRVGRTSNGGRGQAARSTHTVASDMVHSGRLATANSTMVVMMVMAG